MPTTLAEEFLAVLADELAPLGDEERVEMGTVPTDDEARIERLTTHRQRVQIAIRNVEAISLDPAVDSYLTASIGLAAVEALQKFACELLLEIKRARVDLANQRAIRERVESSRQIDADLPTFEEPERAAS